MWTQEAPMQFIQVYLNLVQAELKKEKKSLSLIQKGWIGFCLMGILLTNTVCWAKFERISLKTRSMASLSWMFRHAKISWDFLLVASIRAILRSFKIDSGVLVIDDKDHPRSKNAQKLHRIHKIKDKKTGGYILGQNVVMLYLVTKKVSIPVGFRFYAPDPAIQKWEKEIRKCRKNKKDRSSWPEKPKRAQEYPKKYELALELLSDFKKSFSEIKISALLVDSLYSHKPFMDGIDLLWQGLQVITKMRKNQKVIHENKAISCEDLGKTLSVQEIDITLRSRDKKKVIAAGAKLFVPSHKKKRFVIPMKYETEHEFRYLMATDLSWDMQSIMDIFSSRWLIEVFFEDWSCYNGFCSLAKQCGDEGSLRPLTLSLLFDHCFFFHSEQKVLLENNSSLTTFGTLIEKVRAQALHEFIQTIVEDESPKKRLQEFANNIDFVFQLRKSKKHLSGTEDFQKQDSA